MCLRRIRGIRIADGIRKSKMRIKTLEDDTISGQTAAAAMDGDISQKSMGNKVSRR